MSQVIPTEAERVSLYILHISALADIDKQSGQSPRYRTVGENPSH